MSDDFLASSASFCLVVCFTSAYAFKDTALTGLQDIRDKMSIEQKEVYILNTQALTVLITGSAIATLVVSAVIFGVQFAQEGARRRREALTNKAHRLK